MIIKIEYGILISYKLDKDTKKSENEAPLSINNRAIVISEYYFDTDMRNF